MASSGLSPNTYYPRHNELITPATAYKSSQRPNLFSFSSRFPEVPRLLSFVVCTHDEMATKTQFAAAFLLLSIISSSYASAQLLQCPLQLVQVAACAPLSIINLGPLTTFLQNLCCGLFGVLTGNQTASCLCVSLKVAVLGLNINLPGAINIVLSACGKNVTIGGCP